MKKYGLIFLSAFCPALFSADLLSVYQDALNSDPTYLSAKSTYEAAIQDVPISRAVLLPQLSLQNGSNGSLFLNKAKYSGAAQTNNTTSSRGYGVGLSLTQSIFDFSAIESFRSAKDSVKAAAETYYAALQTLMLTVATDYFLVLQNQENLVYAEANVAAFQSSLTQAQQQYQVGTNTLTDVYAAEAAYSSAVSQQVSANSALQDAIENLRAITGKAYDNFAPLAEDFPLVSPEPQNIDTWVKTALAHNPTIKAANYTASAAMKTVKAAWGGHLPNVDLNASYGTDYQYQFSNDISDAGSARTNGGSVGVNVTMPLFEGGLVTAQTKQAEANYETAIHNLTLQHRSVETNTREDFLNILATISAVKADKTSVKSNESALKGLEAGYRVGTQTMIDVINQQSLLLAAEQAYAADRYQYITSLVRLKNDAGILDFKDLKAINDWLGENKKPAADVDNKQGLHILHDET